MNPRGIMPIGDGLATASESISNFFWGVKDQAVAAGQTVGEVADWAYDGAAGVVGDAGDAIAGYGSTAGKLYDAYTYGELNTAPNPAVAGDGEDIKALFQEMSYDNLGLTEGQFATMDPIRRNALINAAYARFYQADPDTYKWAGMAAMASDKAGTGMMQTYMLEASGAVPGGESAAGALGAPEGDEVRRLLAKGNAGIFNDMYWQHLAFDRGGLEMIEAAAEQGSIAPEQVDGWRQLALAREAMTEARAGGDPALLERAQADIWAANKTLLSAEQGFVQDLVYDESPASREAFQFLSTDANLLGIVSPVPGGTTFNMNRAEKDGAADVGDFGQRWDWIEENMLPEYIGFEGQTDRMNGEMNRYIEREDQDAWAAKGMDPFTPGYGSPVLPFKNPFPGLFSNLF